MTDLAVIMSISKNDRLGFVKESVQSILNQTFSQFHYFLIFDGPVQPEVETYVKALPDKRIKLFSLKNNSGLATALNFLLEIVLKNSEYKFIGRMDADDISLPDRVKKQRNYLLENRDVTIVGSWYKEINERGEHLSFWKLPTDHESLKRRYFIRTPFAHPSVMFRRELIEVAGYYPTDTILMEDNVLWGRALKSGLKLANMPEYLLEFRITKDFYKRRSGIKYGWNFIRSRFAAIEGLNAPIYSYFILAGMGSLKMLPSYFLKHIYKMFY